MLMNRNEPSNLNEDVGFLTVRVSTAGGAIPRESAAVNIRGGNVDDSAVIYALSTNSDGLTPTVPLEAPARSASVTPDSTVPPYAVYNVDVFASGYSPAFFHNVPIFSGINSIQPAVLLPEIENQTQDGSVHVTETPTEGDPI